MVGAQQQVVVLKRLDLLGFLLRDGSLANLVTLRHEHGDREVLDAIELVEGALSVARVGPVLNVLLEAIGLAGLLPVILVLHWVGTVTILILSPVADLFIKLGANFGLVLPPSGRPRGVDPNAVQLFLDVASPIDAAL